MELLIKKRSPVRGNFTKTYNALTSSLAEENPQEENIKVIYANLERIFQSLAVLDDGICNMLLDTPETGKYEAEYNAIEEYNEKMVSAKVNFELYLEKNAKQLRASSDACSLAPKKNLKLPKIELVKFSGEVKDWLSFWSQFSRIHDDEFMNDEDKFQYLIQCMVNGSRAKEIVDSYPPSADNYTKVIESLKARFGRDELLVEYYVRELLTLVVKNAMDTKAKLSIMQLYDKLESYLRSLESIGVTTEKYAAMLFPLVESSVPEDILRVWLRNPVLSKGDSYGDKLSQLLSFLRAEVEGEERISLAKTGFKQNDSSQRKKDKYSEMSSTPVATANDLFTSNRKKEASSNCIFCLKGHESKECFQAQNMSLQEKQEKIKQKRACFACLKIGHTSKKCGTYVRCIICGRKHWTIMCPTIATFNKEKEARKVENVEEIQTASMSNSCSGEVLLQTLLVKLESNEGSRTVRAIIDSGAQQSYILKSTAREMGYKPVGSKDLTHILFGGTTTEKKSHNCYKIKVSSMSKNFSCTLQVLDQGAICGKLPRLNRGPWEKELKQKNIWISDYGDGRPEIELLIGSDVCGTLFTGNMETLSCGLVAVETKLGWIIMGKVTAFENKKVASVTISSLLSQTASIANLWELDIIGIKDPCERQAREELDRAAYDSFNQTVRRDGRGRYEVKLLWSQNTDDLCNNRDAAGKRLLSVTSRLVKENMFDSYDAVFHEWLHEGIIEKTDEGPGHYLPHRGVFKPNSTTKVRPVFDASSKSKGGLSLNNCLLKGPNLLDLIPAKLLTFREKNFGVISDIRKAFLQISVSEEDRQFLKFLWWKDRDKKTVQVFQHKRVVFGLNCSPFLLNAVINHHLEQYTSTPLQETAQQLKSSFYVDNCVSSVDSEEELETFVTNSTNIMAAARFDLRGWESTNDLLSKETNEPSHVLGLQWDRSEDVLFCDTRAIKLLDCIVTRRTILSIAHKVFDPIGFTCPVTVYPKRLLQESWRSKISWDAEVAEGVKDRFLKWLAELQDLTNVRIPRKAFSTASDHQSLHVFCDASGISYAAVVFLRSEIGGNCEVQLLMAKSRIAPLKAISIPRLELLSCCVGARLLDFVKRSLNLEDIEVFCWTDSATALHWITNDEPWGVFVLNRVKEIRKLSDVRFWRHIPGQYNPADLPSRGCSVEKLICSKWWEGPSWLKLGEEAWPHSEVSVQKEEISQERKTTVVAVNITKEPPWYCRRFSSYLKIVRTIAWMKRFVNNSKKPASERNTSTFTVVDIEEAEIILLRLIQREAFDTIKADALKCLRPTLDEDGLIRTATRLVHRQDTDSFKRPIVLPSKHPVVKLLILAEHRSMSHAGVQTLMTRLREKYWILQCRRTVRQALRDCKNCRRFDASRTEVAPAPLPENRVKDAAAFQVIGIDLGGPLYLQTGEKAWFVLFTCAVIRAVHVELVLSLSTDSFLLAFRRFVARRGRPHVVYSDNGTNLVGANNALQGINWETIKDVSLAQRIQWIFIPPTAAWWGGWWERLVGLIKNILRRVLGKARLGHDELITVLCEAENIVNLRPLTYLSEDVEDLLPLTPSLFLQGENDSSVPDLEDLDSVSMNKRYRYRQRLKENLRKRFRTEYLGQLRPYSWKRCPTPLQIGQIVLVGNDNSKRLSWPLAKVLELYPGKDGNIRVARLKTANGEILRPLQRLYPMEMAPDSYNGGIPKDNEFASSEQPGGSVKGEHNKVVESAQTQTRLRRPIKIPSRFKDFELKY